MEKKLDDSEIAELTWEDTQKPEIMNAINQPTMKASLDCAIQDMNSKLSPGENITQVQYIGDNTWKKVTGDENFKPVDETFELVVSKNGIAILTHELINKIAKSPHQHEQIQRSGGRQQSISVGA